MVLTSSQKPYPHAPITEAIIDFRVELPPKVSVSDLLSVHKGEEAAYPTVGHLHSAVGLMQLGAQISTSASSQHTGFRFQSADGKQVHQARLNGFSMSRLAPYQSWDEFSCEARRLWEIYRAVATPSAVVRAAVRYINRIDLPLPIRDFEDYLRTIPQVSPDLPQALLGFFFQLRIPLEDIQSEAMIIATIMDQESPHFVPVVLDIDAFRTLDIPPDDDGLWALMEDLRRAKNRIFEACITDRTRELFR
jgi:uncharacterized protein (TIGR04255 family)